MILVCACIISKYSYVIIKSPFNNNNENYIWRRASSLNIHINKLHPLHKEILKSTFCVRMHLM